MMNAVSYVSVTDTQDGSKCIISISSAAQGASYRQNTGLW